MYVHNSTPEVHNMYNGTNRDQVRDMRLMYYTASVCLRPQTAHLVPGHVYLEGGCKEKGVHYPSINTPLHTTSLNGNETNH